MFLFLAEDYEAFLNNVDELGFAELGFAELKPGNMAEQIGRIF